MSFFIEAFGEGKDLDGLQMALRAVVIFFATLLLIRVAGRRSLGQGSPFDAVIAILLGATASRGIVGASPVLPTLIACVVLALLHRCVGWLSSRWALIADLISGPSRLLYAFGTYDSEELSKALLSRRDIEHALRQQLHLESMASINKVYLERNGRLSFVVSGNRSQDG